jgi:hypothetical protein
MKREPAPIFADTFSLCEWLLGRLEQSERVLARRICEEALLLLDAVGLALQGRGVGSRLDEADERLIMLRIKLRLAGSVELLTKEQLVFALKSTDAIGRQLGGWLRSLGPT